MPSNKGRRQKEQQATSPAKGAGTEGLSHSERLAAVLQQVSRADFECKPGLMVQLDEAEQDAKDLTTVLDALKADDVQPEEVAKATAMIEEGELDQRRVVGPRSGRQQPATGDWAAAACSRGQSAGSASASIRQGRRMAAVGRLVRLL